MVACDMPSGVDASTGEAAGAAVRASCTVTFHAGQAGAVDRPGQGACRRGARSSTSAIPNGAPPEPQVGLIDAAGARRRSHAAAASRRSSPPAAVLVCGGSTGLTGAPMPGLRGGAAGRRRVRHRARPSVAEPRLRAAAAGGDVGAAARRGRRAAAAGAGAVLERAERAGRARARSRARPRRPGPRARPQAGRAVPRSRCCSTPTASTRTPAASRRWPDAPRADGADPARRRARHGCWSATSDEIAAHRLAARRARPRDALEAIVVLKGDDTLVAEPGGRVGGQPRRRARAGHGGDRGRALRRDRGVPVQAAWTRSTRPAPACSSTPGRAGSPPTRIGAEGVIARDVIELPARTRVRAPLRSEPRPRVLRALARVNLAAIERNAARLRARLGRRRGSCARWSRRDASGHGAAPVARAALAGGATLAGGGDRRRGGGAARSRDAEVPGARAGRAERARSCRRRWRAGAEVVAWIAAVRRAIASGGAEARHRAPVRVHVKLDTGHGPAGHARARRGRWPSPSGCASRRGTRSAGRDDPLRDRRRRPRRSSPRSWQAFAPFVERLRRGRAGSSSTPPTARRRCASRAATSTWCAAGSRSRLRSDEPGPRRSRTSSRRWSCTSYVAAVKRAVARGERRLRPAVHRRARDVDRDRADRLCRRRARAA